MSSRVETGMSTLVAHFQLLIDVVKGFGDSYRPSAATLQLPQLTALLDAARSAIEQVDRLLPLCITAESVRHAKFALLPSLTTRI